RGRPDRARLRHGARLRAVPAVGQAAEQGPGRRPAQAGRQRGAGEDAGLAAGEPAVRHGGLRCNHLAGRSGGGLMLVDRRFLLRRVPPALAAALLPASAFGKAAKAPAAAHVAVKDVNGLTLFDVAGCNVIALPGPDGALLVDGGRAGDAAALMQAISGALKT